MRNRNDVRAYMYAQYRNAEKKSIDSSSGGKYIHFVILSQRRIKTAIKSGEAVNCAHLRETQGSSPVLF